MFILISDCVCVCVVCVCVCVCVLKSGDMKITNHTTKEECNLKFQAYSYFSRERQRKVRGFQKFVRERRRVERWGDGGTGGRGGGGVERWGAEIHCQWDIWLGLGTCTSG